MAPTPANIKSDASDCEAFSGMIHRPLMADDNSRGAADAVPTPDPPPVAAPFHWTRESWGAALRAGPIEPHVKHLFTTSQLWLPANASQEERERAWEALTRSLGVPRESLQRVRQVHGRAVRVVRRDDPASAGSGQLPDGDAIVSNVPGTTLAVVVADCVPLLLVDPRAGAAAAIHAGWRGTCAGVTGAAVDAMCDAWATDPADLWAAIGPSIGPSDYEVGDSVLEAFTDAGHGHATRRWFTRGEDGRLTLDLWRANVDQLVSAGVRRERIFVAGLSTAAHKGWLESYRRDGAAAGRLVAAIVTPDGERVKS
jgi:YfiH family protein